jgi:hypothetical protein
VAHRLDAVGVDRLHLLDEAEDAVELGARGVEFGVGEAMRARRAMCPTWSLESDMA